MSFVLALDAGHGYNTPGKRMPDGTREWSLNSKVCNYLQTMLKDYDVKVIRLDDTTGKTDVGLYDGRMKKAVNNKVDACVSVHHNAGTPAKGESYGNFTGVEVIVNVKASADCKKLANNILKYLPTETGLKSRGLKTSDYFTMVMKQSFPTMIIEGGFMNGVKDAKVLKTAAYQKGYAKAILEGLLATYPDKIVKKSSTKNTTSNSTKKETSTTTIKEETVKKEEKVVTKKTTANLWLRKTPKVTNDNKVTVIPVNTTVTVLDSSNKDWYKVSFVKSGKTYEGYSSTGYLK